MPDRAPRTPARPQLRRDFRERAAAARPRATEPDPRVPYSPSQGEAASALPSSAVTISMSRRPYRPRRWARTKTIVAALGITGLITGAALPSMPDAEQDDSQSLVVIEAQSLKVDDDVSLETFTRGTFTATTEDELKERRRQAVLAATAAGIPLSIANKLTPTDRVRIPLTAGSYTLTSTFGASRPGRTHIGQDFAAHVGTPIYAAIAGCVSLSSESYAGYGVTVKVESLFDGDAVSTLYSHLNYGTRAVSVGDCVEEGQYLGDVGSTGYVRGSCLHFEVYVNGRAINPMSWLREHAG